MNWYSYVAQTGRLPAWPYEVRYGQERVVECDVLVVSGGVAGCRAAIEARKHGCTVAVMDRGFSKHSGNGGAGVDHWHGAVTNPCSKVTPEMYSETAMICAGGYTNGSARYIIGKEGWDTLLEAEQMGVQIRNPDNSHRDWEGYYKQQTDRFDREQKLVKCHGGDYFLTLVSFMGFEGALLAMAEEPEEVYALFDYVSQHYLEVMEKQLDYVKPDIYTIMDDDAAARSPFISLRTYRELVRPFHERHARLARERGVFLDWHDCGHCEQFIDDWVQMGVCSWNPAQVSNDLVGIKRRYGNRLALCGAWDNTGYAGSTAIPVEELREKLIDYVDAFAPGGFVYAPGVSGKADDPAVIERRAVIRDVYEHYARDYYKTH